jgi:hypothetical protein
LRAKFVRASSARVAQHGGKLRTKKEIGVVLHLFANRQLGSNNYTGDSTKGTVIQVAN